MRSDVARRWVALPCWKMWWYGPGGSAMARLGLAVLLAAAVTAVLVTAGRAYRPDYSASIFGQTAVGALALKSWLATITFGLAGVQVLLALWLCRRLP